MYTGSAGKFRENIRRGLNHWQGDHSECTHHGNDWVATYDYLEDEYDIEDVEKLFERVCSDAEALVCGYRSNTCEAWNLMKLVIILKFSLSYFPVFNPFIIDVLILHPSSTLLISNRCTLVND